MTIYDQKGRKYRLNRKKWKPISAKEKKEDLSNISYKNERCVSSLASRLNSITIQLSTIQMQNDFRCIEMYLSLCQP